MAVHHNATIVPTKLELLREWVPRQPWAAGAHTSDLVRLGSYRFDDPAGEVGMETHLLGTRDGQVLQVPLTYRGAPRPDAEGSLVTTMTHTTLGRRWVYDACHDPVYVATLASTILTGGRQADLFLATPDGLVPEPVSAQVRGSGSAAAPELPDLLPDLPDLGAPVVTHEGTVTRIEAGVVLTLLRVPGGPGPAIATPAGPTLTGVWAGQDVPVLLAFLA